MEKNKDNLPGETSESDGTPIVTRTGLLFKLTVRGEGLVLHEAGKIVVLGPNRIIVFEAGPHPILEGNVGALCAALVDP